MSFKKILSIRDLALATGFSKTAVSEALRGSDQVSLATREKVVQMAEKLGYAQDARISMLMAHIRQRNKTKNVNLAWLQYSIDYLPQRRLPWYAGLWDGAQARAAETGYSLEEVILKETDYTPKRVRGILLSRGIEGVILSPSYDENYFTQFDWSELASVSCGSEAELSPNHFVGTNYRDNLTIILHKICELGYKRPALWLKNMVDIETMSAIGGTYLFHTQQLFKKDQIPWEADKQILSKWFKKYQPDVIICLENTMIQLLAECGVSVPQDVGVVHINVCSDVAGWAGINQRNEDIGKMAIDILASQLMYNKRELPSTKTTTVLTGQWLDGWTLPSRI